MAFRPQARAVFLYAFAKSERGNIAADELVTLEEIAAAWLAADDGKIEHAIAQGLLQEIGT